VKYLAMLLIHALMAFFFDLIPCLAPGVGFLLVCPVTKIPRSLSLFFISFNILSMYSITNPHQYNIYILDKDIQH
jgi:hypothetical protein